jgi:long-chain acyl-CoA synthetase
MECVIRPITWFLAKPHVVVSGSPFPNEPMLIVANHITAYDGPLLEYALPAPLRNHIAVAMSGEMLEAFRHWRNPKHLPLDGGFYIFGWPAWFLVTTLFNVFPLASTRDFQASFSHAGKALDRGYSVMVFPEGARSPGGKTARFRPGIGLLVKQSSAPVLPMALRGLGELKLQKEGWFRSGDIEVVVGEPIRFAPDASEATITARLQQEVERLMDGATDHAEMPEPVASSR